MDLLALPDEMLATVLKFFKFDTIVQLRKTNFRIDQVAVKYGINKPKCFVIGAEQDRLVIRYRTSNMEENRTTRSEQHVHIFPCSDPLHMVETTLKKVRSLESLWINRQDVDMAWLKLLDSMKQRHRLKVVLMQCNYKVSLEDLKRVLSKFKNGEICLSTEHVIREESVITDEVVCFIFSFAELTIGVSEREKRLPEITDKTLKKLQNDLSKKFTISEHSANFTLSEVIKTFKIGIMNPCQPPRYWNLGRVKVNLIDELDRAFNELSSIKGIRITDMRRPESLSFNAWFKDGICGYMVTIEML